MDPTDATAATDAPGTDRGHEAVVRSTGATPNFAGVGGGTDDADDTDHQASATGGIGAEVVRVRLVRTERVSDAETRVSYDIHLPGGCLPIGGTLALPFPSSMSDLDFELRTAVLDVLADAGLPRQLVDTLVYD